MNPREIPVITHHCINNHPKDNPLGVIAFSADELVGHLQYLTDAGYEMVSVREAVQRAYAGRLGRSLVAVLTFDDGFLDNYLIVPEILRQFRATATFFVNPTHAVEGPVRTLSEHPNSWGFLNFDEMRALEKQGTVEVQSHTMTHDFNFISDRLVDLYTPRKFSHYYWLAWKLDPSTKTSWTGNAYELADRIPSGYPVFEWGRCMQAREFIPSMAFVDLCTRRFAQQGETSRAQLAVCAEKGTFESQEAYEKRTAWELSESKRVLEQQLSKTIDTVCFPGDAYNCTILSQAASAGYKTYMRHPREEGDSNLSALLSAPEAHRRGQMIGLRRLGIFSEYPRALPQKAMGYWMTKVAVRAFIGVSGYSRFLSAGRVVKRTAKALLGQTYD